MSSKTPGLSARVLGAIGTRSWVHAVRVKKKSKTEFPCVRISQEGKLCHCPSSEGGLLRADLFHECFVVTSFIRTNIQVFRNWCSKRKTENNIWSFGSTSLRLKLLLATKLRGRSSFTRDAPREQALRQSAWRGVK